MPGSINTTPLLQDSEEEDLSIDQDDVEIRGNKLLEPIDKYHLAYFIFYLLGIVTLLPWNFFITADDYWMYKFREVNNSNLTWIGVTKRTPLQASFTSYISVASAVPSLIFLFVNSLISQRVCLHKRILGSLGVMLFLFSSTLAFVNINTDTWQDTFFTITLITIVLLNVCSAILSGSVFGIIGKFSHEYITAAIGGQALGGIFAAAAEICSLLIGASSTHAALVYFIIGNLTIFIAIICYIILIKTIFFKYHVVLKQINLNELSSVSPRDVSFKIIIKRIWTYGLAMFFCFAITLSVYPGVTVLIESEGKGNGNKWNDVFFVPTICYLLFSIGDYLGRLLAGKLQTPKKGSLLLIFSIARFVFIPLLMLCNAQPRKYWAVVFSRDYQYIIILFLCALSNGYLANITAIFAPRMVDHHEKEIASTLMTVFMGFGLALGSAISLVMVKVL